ncbi:Na-translocating system protein MpsC family protein [Marinicrinis lubricantis]|uniref:Na-translocating system protein MpsC family protein n=1 Tax=Marinicrinis lubricantis TaxID=2086470 RepID=A0ABW1IRS5_9BACL
MFRSSMYQEDLIRLTSSLSKLLKQRFGKGPEKCFVTFYRNRLTVNIRNFVTSAEEVLIEHDQTSLALHFRSAVMDKVCKEFAQEACSVLGTSFDLYYNDWDYVMNSGILLMESKQAKEEAAEWGCPITGPLFEQIRQLSSEGYKVPDRMDLIQLNQNTYAVNCEGILLQIEKELLKRGHLDILQDRFLEMKKKYMLERKAFAKIFGRDIEGLFMTWDIHQDQSYIFFCLE